MFQARHKTGDQAWYYLTEHKLRAVLGEFSEARINGYIRDMKKGSEFNYGAGVYRYVAATVCICKLDNGEYRVYDSWNPSRESAERWAAHEGKDLVYLGYGEIHSLSGAELKGKEKSKGYFFRHRLPGESGKNLSEAITLLLDQLTSDERHALFHKYCVHCGDKNPKCNCMKEE